MAVLELALFPPLVRFFIGLGMILVIFIGVFVFAYFLSKGGGEE